MKSRLLIATALAIGVLSARLAAAGLYCTTWYGQVLSVNEQTWTTVEVGRSGYSRVNSLARDASGLLYTVAQETWPAGLPTPGAVLTLNLDTGQGTQVSAISFDGFPCSVRALAFDASGVLHVVTADDQGAGYPFRLYTADLGTGVTSLVGTLTSADGLVHIQGMDFAADGTLYGWDTHRHGLVTIDAATAWATDVNPLVTSPDLQSIAFAPDGMLYGVDSHYVYSVNAATGVATQVCTTIVGSDLRGIEYVPEPATMTLLGLGLSATVARRRRRVAR